MLNTDHPAFAGLPRSVRLNDESYWNLLRRDNVEIIGTIIPADGKKRSFRKRWIIPRPDPRPSGPTLPGRARSFGTTTGHYTYTFHDPMVRLLLVRGIAWALDEDPAPFLPIVFEGITDDEGMVGTTDLMMEYENRER